MGSNGWSMPASNPQRSPRRRRIMRRPTGSKPELAMGSAFSRSSGNHGDWEGVEPVALQRTPFSKRARKRAQALCGSTNAAPAGNRQFPLASWVSASLPASPSGSSFRPSRLQARIPDTRPITKASNPFPPIRLAIPIAPISPLVSYSGPARSSSPPFASQPARTPVLLSGPDPMGG